MQSIWERYSEVWTLDREEYVDELARKKPKLKDFEEELYKYKMTTSQLSTEKDEFRFGSILIRDGDL